MAVQFKGNCGKGSYNAPEYVNGRGAIIDLLILFISAPISCSQNFKKQIEFFGQIFHVKQK